MSPSRPALTCAAGLVLLGLAADLPLIRRGLPPISTATRQSRAARAIAAGLALHLIFEIPHDPLTALGRRVERIKRDGRLVPALQGPY